MNLHSYGHIPVRIADLLGEQLLTEVKPCLNKTALLAKLSMLGVLTALLPYTPISNPPSSMNISSTFFLSSANGAAALAMVTHSSSSNVTYEIERKCDAIFLSEHVTRTDVVVSAAVRTVFK